MTATRVPMTISDDRLDDRGHITLPGGSGVKGRRLGSAILSALAVRSTIWSPNCSATPPGSIGHCTGEESPSTEPLTPLSFDLSGWVRC